MADPYAAFSSPVANDPYAAFSSPDKAPSAAASSAVAPLTAEDVKKYYANPKNRRDPIQDISALTYGAETGIIGIPGALESLGRSGLRALGADVSEKTALPTPADVRSFATKHAGFPSMEGDSRIAAGEIIPAIGPTAALAAKIPAIAKSVAAMPSMVSAANAVKSVPTKLADLLTGPDVAIAKQKLAALKPAVSNQATMLEAGQIATDVAPPLARPINEAGNAALKEQSDPLFTEAFKPTSTAPLKDQYENANKAAGLALRKAQNAVSDAENSHTQLLAKANDQTSVYGINPGQIRQSEKAIEEANKSLELAQVQKDQVAKDLRGVQEDILSGKQGAAYTPQISILLNNPKVKKGISQGIAVMRDEADAEGVPLNLTDLGVKLDKTGNPVLDANGDVQVIGVPKTRLLHIAKIGLNDIYNGYKDKLTGIIPKDSQGAARAVNKLADSLVTELRTVNPKYNEAMDISQKYITSRKGFTKGATSIFNDKIDERTFAKMLKNMTPEEINALPEGVSNYTYELTRKLPAETAAGETANPALPQPSMLVPKNVISQRSQGKLAMVPKIGPEKAQTFIETLRDVKSNPARVSEANQELAKAMAARKKTIRNVALAGAGAVGLGAAGRHVMPYVLP